jgi:predicted transcriptional regulator
MEPEVGTRVRKARRTAKGLLGPLEYEVMTAVWAAAPAGVPQVLERLNKRRSDDKKLAYTTVMTVLARLHEKGVLDRERRGRGYAYTPRFSESELVEYLSRQEVTGLLERYGEVALAQFLSVVDRADPDVLERLRELEASGDA